MCSIFLYEKMTHNTKKEYKLDPDSELRFEIESKNKTLTLELKSGLAEIFGTELVTNKKYEFLPGSRIAVFTWQGCILELCGTPDVTYIAKETPMLIYLNCHAVLERLRELSEKEDEKGPVTMIVGPCNVGKSTISQIIANYALRMHRKPIYVNLDVGQVEFAVPGTIGALLLNKPMNIEEGYIKEGPLVFHFGYDSPESNETLYRHLITRLAQVCNDRMMINQKAKHSGIIINTCGWIKGEGYKSLMHIAQAFEVDNIFVIDQETLYNDLLKDIPDFVKVILLPKSGGVILKSYNKRIDARNSSIHNYFYGIPKLRFYSHRIELKFEDFSIYKIVSTSSSMSTHGMRHENITTKLVLLHPTSNMKNHLLSVSCADSNQDDVAQSNIAGFLHVEKVNTQKKILTVLSPQPRLIYSVFLLSEVKYFDNS